LSIILEPYEKGNIDEALTWSKADFEAIKKTKHALEQQQLAKDLLASLADGEAEQTRKDVGTPEGVGQGECPNGGVGKGQGTDGAF
jgi:hypothetical protein